MKVNSIIIFYCSKLKNFYIIIFYLLQFSRIILNECPRNEPFNEKIDIMPNWKCVKKCSNTGYECILNNSIIKSQFPNDIIFVGERTQRYLNFVTLLNGDILFQTSSYPCYDGKRKFYGLKKNGRGFFINENEQETPFYSLISSQVHKYESANAIFIKNGN